MLFKRVPPVPTKFSPRARAKSEDTHQIQAKYWPPVARIENVYGDKHLDCSCPPVADYE